MTSVATKFITKLDPPSAAYPTRQVFVDESGVANQSAYVAVGALTFVHDHGVTGNRLQQFRDTSGWRGEAHFVDVKKNTAYLYREAMRILVASGCRFSCVVADKTKNDPMKTTRAAWKNYAQLTIAALDPVVGWNRPTLSVVVDNLVTPADVNYEGYIAKALNTKHGYLAVAGINRMDSRACWGLQMVDVLTGAVVHQYRQLNDPGAKAGSVKGQLAAAIASEWGLATLVGAATTRFRVHPL